MEIAANLLNLNPSSPHIGGRLLVLISKVFNILVSQAFISDHLELFLLHVCSIYNSPKYKLTKTFSFLVCLQYKYRATYSDFCWEGGFFKEVNA